MNINLWKYFLKYNIENNISILLNNTFQAISPLIHTIRHVYRTFGPPNKPLVRINVRDCETGLFCQTSSKLL